MKPIKLKLTAFGPFANETIIDFEADLANQQIFVISGPTGAGKTTIFDAICYALYGETSGALRKKQDIRSDFAAASHTITEVEFTFSVRNKTYVVTRRPIQEVVSTRKDKALVKKSGTQSFYEINHREDILEKDKEIKEKLQEVIGLTSDQFRKIVMIPQGDFKEFLMASTKEKELLLRKIFGTDLYEQIQHSLSIQEKKLTEKAAKLRAEIDTKLKSFNFLEAPECIEKIQAEIPSDEKIACCEQYIVNTNQLIEANQSEQISLQEQITILERKYRQVVETNQQFLEFEQITKDVEDLMTQATQIDTLRQQLVAFEAAKLISQHEQVVQEKTRKYEDYSNQKNQTYSHLDLIEKQLADLVVKLNEIPTFERQLTQIRSEYQELVAISKDSALLNHQVQYIQTLEPEVERFKQEVFRLKERKEFLNEQTQSVDVLYEAATANTKQAHEEWNQQQTYENQLVRLKKMSRILAEADTIKAIKVKRVQVLNELTQQEKELTLEHEKMYLASLNGAAVSLASHLKLNMACPVCGSTTHPNLASGSDEVPTKEALTTMNQMIQNVQKQRQDLEKELVAYDQTVSTQQDYLQELCQQGSLAVDDITALEVNDAIQTITQEKSQLEKQYAKTKQLETQLRTQLDEAKKAEQELVEAIKQYDVMNDKLMQLVSQLEIEKRSKDDLLKRIPVTYQVSGMLEKRQQELESEEKNIILQIQTIQTTSQHTQEAKAKTMATLQTLEDVMKEQYEDLQAAISLFDEKIKQKFESVEQYRNSLVPDAKIKEISMYIKGYDEQLYAKQTRQEELTLRLKDSVQEDPVHYELQLVELTTKKEMIQSVIVKLQTVQKHNETLLTDVKKSFEKNKQTEDEYKIVGDLEKLATGKVGNKMTFETYVLLSYFEDILYYANQRLLKMTNKRYELRRREEAMGNGRKGLELDVYDSYTGKIRGASTLSGGESFKASLALALGLSDTVMHNAGGISLDTMFIDEGFGTLDHDSLEQAIEILIELQDNGRLIGVISHVEELKQRISAKLIVEPSPTGSVAYFKK